MPENNHVRERIVDLLRQHSEGLTTKEIADMIGSNRHTIAKYIYLLLGEGMISQRKLGAAKLCYFEG